MSDNGTTYEAGTAEDGRQAGPDGRRLTFEVSNEVYAALVAAGPALNDQRPNQIAKLLVSEGNVAALIQKWQRMFDGGGSSIG